jgi:phenylacetate-CoA ligase
VKKNQRSALDLWIRTKIGLASHEPLSRQALTYYQLEKLRGTLDYVKRCSSFYRRHLSDYLPRNVLTLDDFYQWPLTIGEHLRADPLAFLCVSQSAVERVVTLRTRAMPVRAKRLFFSSADLELAIDFFHHGFSTLVEPQQRMLILMPGQQPYSVGDLLARGLRRLAVKAVPHGPIQSLEGVVAAIIRHRIDCLVGVPSEMADLVRFSGATRIPRDQIKSIWLGTQNTFRSIVGELSDFWSCPVMQHYGAAEMCPGGGVECAAQNGFHLREADLLIEIIDPHTHLPIADGCRGEVVVTTLTREAMPLVRYRTGHQAAWITSDCFCGSPLRRLQLMTHGH